MRIRLKDELLLASSLALLLIIIIAFSPDSVWRIILGLPLLLFIPGYVLLAALLPRKTSLDAVERVALGFGLSIAVTSLIGLLLNSTPWGIRLYPILVTLTFFIVITSIIAWYRSKRLPEEERPTLLLNVTLHRWRIQNLTNKILSIVLAVTILGAAGTLVYVLATPKVEESFTEFYLLGSDTKMENYPEKAVVGKEVSVVVGIINHEHKTLTYRITIMIDGITSGDVGPLVLAPNEVWEKAVTFIPTRAGDNQKAEFLLYENGENKPYSEPLHLGLDVKEATSIKQ